jgi:hypothetical protein
MKQQQTDAFLSNEGSSSFTRTFTTDTLQAEQDDTVMVSLLRRADSDGPIVSLTPPPFYNLTKRGGNIDTTPGSDQVDNFRPRHFRSERGAVTQLIHEGESSPTTPFEHASGQLSNREARVSPIFHSRRVSVLEDDDEDDDFDGHRDDLLHDDDMSIAIPVDIKTKTSHAEASISSKFCGVTLPKDVQVHDMTACCGSFRDKLLCFFEASTTSKVNIHKTLPKDNDMMHPGKTEKTPARDTAAVNEDDLSWNQDRFRDMKQNEIDQRFHSNGIPEGYQMHLAINETENSTVASTMSDESSRTAVSKSPRRLRLARLHKQRMQQQQQQQHRVGNLHQLSIP